MATSLFGTSSTATKGETPYDFSVKDIDGKEVDLSKYRGKVILVVNVASQCGEHHKPLTKPAPMDLTEAIFFL